MSLSAIAKRFDFVRETDGENNGAFVSFFQRWTGNVPPDSWCASFVSVIENIDRRGKVVLPRTASCQEKLDVARRLTLIVTEPQVDDLYFYVNSVGHAHHVGVVSGVDPLTGIAGNTSEDGASSEGTGVYEHAINPASCVFVRLP